MEGLEAPKTLIDQAYEVILDAVCDGTFKPGERLTQEDIASRLNVSRQPVTHALTVLKAQGFLVQAGRRGLTVPPIDETSVELIYRLRSAVEPFAVKLATPTLTKETIREGHTLVARGRQLAKAGDAKAVLQADMDFHSFIYRMAGHPMIEDIMRPNWHHLRRSMSQILRYVPSVGIWQEHERILEAMIEGHAEEAADLMRQHLMDAFERAQADAERAGEADQLNG